MELDTLIVIRCGFENRINRTDKKSAAYNSLAKEYPIIKQRITPLFKNEAIYIPILHSWRTNSVQVVGTVILSGFNEESSRKGKESSYQQKQAGISKIVNGSLLREIMDQMSFFANLCILDMSYRKKDQNFRSMSNMSKFIFFNSFSVHVQI